MKVQKLDAWSVGFDALTDLMELALLFRDALMSDQEIAEFIAERDGYPARADRIYLTNGASEGRDGMHILLLLRLTAVAFLRFIFLLLFWTICACVLIAVLSSAPALVRFDPRPAHHVFPFIVIASAVPH